MKDDRAIKRKMLILKLAWNLMECDDLNDEDTALLSELIQHSVIQTVFNKKVTVENCIDNSNSI